MSRAAPPDPFDLVMVKRNKVFRFAEKAGLPTQRGTNVSYALRANPKRSQQFQTVAWARELVQALDSASWPTWVGAGEAQELRAAGLVSALRATNRLPSEEGILGALAAVRLASNAWLALAHYLAGAGCLFNSDDDRPLLTLSGIAACVPDGP